MDAETAYWRYQAVRSVDELCEVWERVVMGGIIRFGRYALRVAYSMGCAFFDHDRQSLFVALLYVARVVGAWSPASGATANAWCPMERAAACQLAHWKPEELQTMEVYAVSAGDFYCHCQELKSAHRRAAWS